MDSEFQPPVPRSMSDADLEAALELAKNQSDGMLAAMMLLEQESQLRAEDEAATEAWIQAMKNDSRPQARLALENFERATAGLEPLLEQIPETDSLRVEEMPQAVAYEAFIEPNPVQDVISPLPEVHEESGVPVFEPEPIPAPVIEEVAFDELLAIGAQEATEGIQVVDDFSVTGVVQKITEKVEEQFAGSAEEVATAYEEVQTQSVVPVATEVLPSSRMRSWIKIFGETLISGLVLPILAVFYAKSTSISLASLLVGAAIGLLVSFGIGLVADRMLSRGAASISVLSRATFGVYGNMLPTVFNLVFRFILTFAAISLLSSAPAKTIQGLDLSSTWLGFTGTTWFAIGLTFLALSVGLLPKIAARFVSAVALLGGLVWSGLLPVFNPATTFDFGTIDIPSVITITVLFTLASIAITGLKSRPSKYESKIYLPLILRVAMPILVVFGVGVSGLQVPSFGVTAYESTVFALPNWLGTYTNVLFVFLALAFASQLLIFTSEVLAGFFISRRRTALLVSGLLLLGAVVASGFVSGLLQLFSSVLIVALAPVATWVGMILVEALLRRQTFHEVSLVRGYAFYKSISITATIGYMASLAFSVSVTPVVGLAFFGFAEAALNPALVFGPLSGVVYGFAFGVVYSLITSSPKIHRQEQEVAGVFERKAQIAGVELPL